MNKKGKIYIPGTVKRGMAIVLTLMMLISTLLSSGNLIYAADNGLMVLKSATHPEGAVGKAVINKKDVTFTVPFNYSKDTLDLSKVTYVLETGYELDKIEPSSAKVGGISVTMKVHYIYTDDTETTTGNSATFKGSTEYNVKVNRAQPVVDKIKYSVYVNTSVDLDSSDFEEVCLDVTGKRLSYVKFTLPSSSRGTLYSNYGYSDESKVSASSKNYDDDLDEISFVPYNNYTGTVVISYVGYNSNGESYTGQIEIQLLKVDTDADDIIYKTGSYTPINFDYDDFEDECWDVTREELDYVRFSIPSSTYGTLYYKYDTRSQSKVSSTTKYYGDDLDDIIFVPN